MAEAGHFVQGLERFDPWGGLVPIIPIPQGIEHPPTAPHIPTPKGSGDPPTFETVSVIKPSASAKDTLIETQACFSVQVIFLSRCVAVAWDKNIKYCKFSSNLSALVFFLFV